MQTINQQNIRSLSVVIPLYNEAESLIELKDRIVSVVQPMQLSSYEIIFIDDGSTDSSWEVITQMASDDSSVKGIRFFRNYGKSQALHAGFEAVQSQVVITMDADLQDSPEEIPELFYMIYTQGYELVSGWKRKRYDDFLTKNLPSKLFNWVARKVSGLPLHDFNCGLKAYKKEVVKNVKISGEMHRYIPVLAKNEGFFKITEKVVRHQPRKYGQTKFGMERFINGFLDLVTISFMMRFGRRPMHFFGALGVLMFFVGFCFSIYLGIDKLLIHPYGRLITERPQFYIALSTMVIGTQFFLAGFVSELILKIPSDQKHYKIRETI